MGQGFLAFLLPLQVTFYAKPRKIQKTPKMSILSCSAGGIGVGREWPGGCIPVQVVGKVGGPVVFFV